MVDKCIGRIWFILEKFNFDSISNFENETFLCKNSFNFQRNSVAINFLEKKFVAYFDLLRLESLLKYSNYLILNF